MPLPGLLLILCFEILTCCFIFQIYVLPSCFLPLWYSVLPEVLHLCLIVWVFWNIPILPNKGFNSFASPRFSVKGALLYLCLICCLNGICHNVSRTDVTVAHTHYYLWKKTWGSNNVKLLCEANVILATYSIKWKKYVLFFLYGETRRCGV